MLFSKTYQLMIGMISALAICPIAFAVNSANVVSPSCGRITFTCPTFTDNDSITIGGSYSVRAQNCPLMLSVQSNDAFDNPKITFSKNTTAACTRAQLPLKRVAQCIYTISSNDPQLDQKQIYLTLVASYYNCEQISADSTTFNCTSDSTK